MSLVIALEYGLLIKPHKKKYLKILFKDFIEKFDMSEDDCI